MFKQIAANISRAFKALKGEYIYTDDTSDVIKTGNPEYDWLLYDAIYFNKSSRFIYSTAFAKLIINLTSAFISVPKVEGKTITEIDELIPDFELAQTYALLYSKSAIEFFIDKDDGEVRAEVYKPFEYSRGKKKDGDKEIEYYKTTKRIVENNIEIELETEYTANSIIERENGEIKSNIPNPFGFIPIFEFFNGVSMRNSESELNNLVEYLKAYTDTMKQTLKSHKNTKTPKIKFKVRDKPNYIKRNFSDEEIKSRKVDSSKKNVLFFQEDEDAEYLETKNNQFQDTEKLLKMIFYNLVIGSEIPEFCFGTHIKSSNASVGEQIEPILQKTSRKRRILGRQYKKAYKMIRRIKNSTSLTKTKLDTNIKLKWIDTIKRDEKQASEIFKNISVALIELTKNGIISHETAVKKLMKYVEEIRDYKSEAEKIEAGAELLQTLEDIRESTAIENLDKEL